MQKNSGFQVIVTTSNKSMWTLKAFSYLFNTYYSSLQNVHVVCESVPRFHLPVNYICHPVHLDGIVDWPKDRWTDGLVRYLNSIPEQHVLILLDDYWLIRTVDTRGINTLHEYMLERPEVLRVDLTGDRLYAGGMQDVDCYGHFDIVSAQGSQYQMSLMPGLWNKALLLEVLQPNWSPWDVELSGTSIVNDRPELIVVGTRQWPIRIINSLRNEREWVDVSGIDQMHLDHITKNNWLELPMQGQGETPEHIHGYHS